ncbi:stonustoxin subunit alpha-like [Salvelinus alpinus]|uniref:stonustoxin subunit alpha-like n=1 Tax=Salvelinus alpinus TaxID=8036 RepID=UPI0039FBDEC7
MKELDLSYNPLGDVVDLPSELENLKVDYRGENRTNQGLRKYISDASELTLDPSTANCFLSLSEGKREVTRQREMKHYPSTQERFDKCNQVLCKEGLCGRHYLEVECLHDVHIGMAYKQLERKGAGDNVKLGRNAVSWTLCASKDKFHAQHKNNIHNLRLPEIKSNESYRIGVFLDWPAGILSFYNISSESDKLIHLYAFHTTFTEPLYLGLRLQSPTSTISLIVK